MVTDGYIKIHTPAHTKFAANLLCEKLTDLGRKAIVTDNYKQDNDVHIIYNAAAWNRNRMPKKYIVMQTEVPGTHWFSPSYHDIIKNAIAVWDYDVSNQSAYEHSKKSIVRPGVRQPGIYKKDINYLFYGWVDGSPRRRRILDELKEHIDVIEVTDKLGTEMWSILKRTKVVINIHYHEHSPLELYRICEALSFGCQTVTEVEDRTAKDIAVVARCLINEDWSTFPMTYMDNTAEIEAALKQAGI